LNAIEHRRIAVSKREKEQFIMSSKTQKMRANLLNPKCTPPDGGTLPPRQQFALHTFVHEVLASLNRLYMEMPPEEADIFIDPYIPS
jgi:hypothetical protein